MNSWHMLIMLYLFERKSQGTDKCMWMDLKLQLALIKTQNKTMKLVIHLGPKLLKMHCIMKMVLPVQMCTQLHRIGCSLISLLQLFLVVPLLTKTRKILVLSTCQFLWLFPCNCVCTLLLVGLTYIPTILRGRQHLKSILYKLFMV